MSDRTAYEYLCVKCSSGRKGFIPAKHQMVFIKDKSDLLEFWQSLSLVYKKYYKFYDISDNMKSIKKTPNCEELIL